MYLFSYLLLVFLTKIEDFEDKGASVSSLPPIHCPVPKEGIVYKDQNVEIKPDECLIICHPVVRSLTDSSVLHLQAKILL